MAFSVHNLLASKRFLSRTLGDQSLAPLAGDIGEDIGKLQKPALEESQLMTSQLDAGEHRKKKQKCRPGMF